LLRRQRRKTARSIIFLAVLSEGNVDLYAIDFDPVLRAHDAPSWMDENVPQDILDRANVKQELLDSAGGPLRRFLVKRWIGDKDGRHYQGPARSTPPEGCP
jgi:hypothetical protein